MRTTDMMTFSVKELVARGKAQSVGRDEWLQAVIELYGEQAQASSFKTWMTIQLGTNLTTADDFRRAFKADGHRISDWANDMLNHPTFTVAKEKTEVELVKVTVAELGFKNGAIFADICKRASELGLERCPAEVGPQLRLQYKTQPKGEWLLIAMEPISDSNGFPNVWRVERHGYGSWLGSDYGKPSDFWRGGHVWVFVRRKSSSALGLGS